MLGVAVVVAFGVGVVAAVGIVPVCVMGMVIVGRGGVGEVRAFEFQGGNPQNNRGDKEAADNHQDRAEEGDVGLPGDELRGGGEAPVVFRAVTVRGVFFIGVFC